MSLCGWCGGKGYTMEHSLLPPDDCDQCNGTGEELNKENSVAKTKGLTLKEALESGRPFKREHEAEWIDGKNRRTNSVGFDSAIASDWEVAPEKSVTITEAEFDEAFADILRQGYLLDGGFKTELKEKLFSGGET